MRLLAFVPFLSVLAGIALNRSGVLPAMFGLGLFAFAAVFGLVVYFRILLGREHKGKPWNWVFALVAVLPLAFGVAIVVNDLQYPPINDISTDVDDPPAFSAALEDPANAGRDMTYPKDFIPIAREAYPDIQPLVLDAPPEHVFERAVERVQAQSGWAITRQDSTALTIEGEVTTFFFRFVDDFVIRISEQGGKTRVDMRSKSREGLVDAGANANRIRSFLPELAGVEASSD